MKFEGENCPNRTMSFIGEGTRSVPEREREERVVEDGAH